MNITPEHAKEITRNIELFGEFMHYLLDNPSEMEKIPNGSHIRFMESAQKEEPLASASSEKVLKVRKVYEFV
jgi:hypothetical protein